MFGDFTYEWNHIEYIEKEEDFDKVSSGNSYIISQNIILAKKHKFKNISNVCISGSVNVTLNKNTTLKFIDCNYIRICDITFTGDLQPNKYGEITLQFSHCNHCIIDHCVFVDGEDEQLCIKDGSDMFTISNCQFLHNNYQRHAYSILIGKHHKDIPEGGYYHVDIYNCLFRGGRGRNPRCRYSIVHLTKCVWENIKDYVIGPENSEIYINACESINNKGHFIEPYGKYELKIENSPTIKIIESNKRFFR